MNNLRVMVVDDIEQNRYMLQYMLQSQGAIASTADHGESALQQLHDTPHDLIISDILMPVMDGYQLCRECKKDPELANIPFVFYTATYTTDEDRDFSLALGANRFIIKPATPEVLLSMVHEVVAEHVAGKLTPRAPSFNSESELLEKYNSRLVRKLEDKLTQLEQANHKLDAELVRRTKLESQLLQAQKMEAVGTMLGGVSHNFNNILVGILGKLYLARAKLGTDNGFVRCQLDDIDSLASHAAEIISKLMRFSHKEPLQRKIFNLTTLLTKALDTVQIGLPEDVELKIHTPPETLTMDGEEAQIEQLLFNLLTNARDAVAEQPIKRITLTIQTITNRALSTDLPAMAAERIAHITIKDSGCGIHKGQLQSIFDPFFTTKKEGKGTGLGLSTSYAIAHDHQGHITCHSELGTGTSFEVYLPLYQPLSGNKTDAAGPSRPILGNGETILLVEDEEGVRNTTESVLKALGYQVVTAENGWKGFAAFQRQQPSIALVLSDITMPEMNGIELLRAIIASGSQVPIILASGYDMGIFDLSSEEKSRVLLLEKPYRAIPLSQTIHDLLHPQRIN
ncbi:MAG: response regulator [Mariprofundales bacterium]